jgi:D-glycero-D-manno-heptose 1,7-bisphosphate phosphatase
MKAVFLDRDGVINEDDGYVYRKEDFHFKEGIFDFLRGLKEYQLFIVTNQSGIARGYYDEEQFHTLMQWVKEVFLEEGIVIVDIAFCPHHPNITGSCSCRKPQGGMILSLAEQYGINLSSSLLIGDKQSDIEAGHSAGVGRSFLFTGSFSSLKKEIEE